MSLVGKYRFGRFWYLRYNKSIGLPRRSLHTTDKKIAEAIRVDEERKYVLAQFGIREKPLTRVRYSGFVKQFLHYKQGQGRSLNTIAAYGHGLNNFGLSLKRDIYLHDITIDIIETFAAERREAGKAEKTIRNELIALSTAFKFAKRQRYVYANPMEQFELPPKIKYPPRYLSKQDYLKLQSVIDDEEFRDVVDFYLLTGIRRGEGPALRAREHVDLEHCIIKIPQAKQKDYKVLPISDELLPVLKRLILRASPQEQFIRYKEDNLTDRFGKYARKAGLPSGITLHTLRHTFATWLAAVGVRSIAIQELLGQSDPESTKLYVHAYNEDIAGAIGKLRLPKN